MTDRELLELAAKAADEQIDWEDFRDYGSYIAYKLRFENEFWNPLADDGDALRLAVKLRIDICTEENDSHPTEDRQICHVNAWPLGGAGASEDRNPDPYAATRRAVVRAAAEIGKAMP